MKIAFGLAADYAGTVSDDDGERPLYLGGILKAGDREIDTLAELDAGDGLIVVEDTDYEAVRALDDAPALERRDVANTVEASPTLRQVALTGAERIDVDAAIAAGDIVTDDELAEFLKSTSVGEVLDDVGDNIVYAKRAYLAEQARGDDARKSLLRPLYNRIHADAGE